MVSIFGKKYFGFIFTSCLSFAVIVMPGFPAAGHLYSDEALESPCTDSGGSYTQKKHAIDGLDGTPRLFTPIKTACTSAHIVNSSHQAIASIYVQDIKGTICLKLRL